MKKPARILLDFLVLVVSAQQNEEEVTMQSHQGVDLPEDAGLVEYGHGRIRETNSGTCEPHRDDIYHKNVPRLRCKVQVVQGIHLHDGVSTVPTEPSSANSPSQKEEKKTVSIYTHKIAAILAAPIDHAR